MSSSTRFETVKRRMRDKTGIIIGLSCQFIIMPFVGFCATQLIELDPIYQLMLLIVCSSPGGSYSNFMCSVANADLALSVAMTAASTCLSVVFLPLNLLLYSHLALGKQDSLQNLDWEDFSLSLGVVVFGIVLGLYCSYKIEEETTTASMNIKNMKGREEEGVGGDGNGDGDGDGDSDGHGDGDGDTNDVSNSNITTSTNTATNGTATATVNGPLTRSSPGNNSSNSLDR